MDDLLTNIQDIPQKEALLPTIKANYDNYVKKVHKKINTQAYASAANKLVKNNDKLINEFVESIFKFYGTKSLPYDEIVVYVFPVEEQLKTVSAHRFYNTILLPVSNKSQANIKVDLGIVMQEIAHMVYENQEPSLQYAMEDFFFHEPSQYAYIAYQNLNEVMATIIGNSLFVEKLKGKPSVTYTNEYAQGFSEPIYTDIKTYLNNKTTINKDFLKQAVGSFTERFPDAKRDLEAVLVRSVMLVKHFSPEETIGVLANNFPISTGFCSLIDDKEEIEKDIKSRSYDHNAPVIFVSTPEEAENITQFIDANPYLKDIPKEKLEKLPKRGVYCYKNKFDRLHMFFVVNDYQDFNQFLQVLKKQPYLPTYNDIYIMPRGGQRFGD